jgi:hypothetical protein
MLAPRRNNDLDDFISHHAHPRPYPNHAVSPRTAHYHSKAHQDRPTDRNERTVSPNRIANTRKPMINPPRPPKTSPQEQCCTNENHRSKRAEYIIRIEEEDMYYCGICATQAASQGFSVSRINVPKRQKTVPHYPELASNPRYQQLTALMRDIAWLEAEYRRKSPKSVEEHYRHQEELLTDFYDQLLATVEGIRDNHLREFRLEQGKSLAAGEMHYSNLGLHLEDLDEAWEDIEDTFQEVVEKIDPQSFEDGMRTYRNTLSVFRHKLEEFEDVFTQLTTYDEAALTDKLRTAEASVLELWKEQPAEQPTQRRGAH